MKECRLGTLRKLEPAYRAGVEIASDPCMPCTRAGAVGAWAALQLGATMKRRHDRRVGFASGPQASEIPDIIWWPLGEFNRPGSVRVQSSKLDQIPNVDLSDA